jgi:uncharacterized radical SAM superfamily Fe-S cluster-containing enzyme
MKCSCGGPRRSDRPHVFVKQERVACAGCGAPVEARVVLERGEAVRLQRCASCGEKRERLAADGEQYLKRFIAGGLEDGLFKHTTSTCPGCLSLVDARVLVRGGKVYFSKQCVSCGPSEALVSEDAGYYVGAYDFVRAGSQPLKVASQARRGCPEDCGLCPDHEQHSCLPVIEVTDHCNLACPICLVDNRDARHMSVEEFSRIVDGLIAAEGSLESVALSGGEPASHPRILELIDAARRPQIGRVVLLTNGLRLAQDRAFAEALKERRVYVSLQLDGFSAESHVRLRGRDLREQKQAALAVLEELDLATQLVFVAARGVNEHELGQAVELLLSKDHILSLNVQPLAHTGAGGGRFGFDPLDRLTIPGVHRAIEAQTGGKVRASDFYPLPCPNPHCVSLTYLLRLEDGSYLPFPRFADLRRYGSLLRNSATLPALPEVEQALRDVIYDLYSAQDQTPAVQRVLSALRRTMLTMFPERPLGASEVLRVGERQAKSIFVHHYMDPYDFDLERLRKCCHHYPQLDGRLMPMCGFNLFHRGAAKGRGTPRPAWGKGPWERG